MQVSIWIEHRFLDLKQSYKYLLYCLPAVIRKTLEKSGKYALCDHNIK